jgi:hypothetical protein
MSKRNVTLIDLSLLSESRPQETQLMKTTRTGVVVESRTFLRICHLTGGFVFRSYIIESHSSYKKRKRLSAIICNCFFLLSIYSRISHTVMKKGYEKKRICKKRQGNCDGVRRGFGAKRLQNC